MKRLLLPFLLLSVALCARADIASERWPAALRSFSHHLPASVTQGAYRITISEPSDPEVQQLGGSGGRIYTFTVSHLPSGRRRTFDDQSVGVRLLRPLFDGRPQLEIWGRGGGGSWSRCLTRFVRGEYRCVRIDDFTELETEAKNRSVTATLPGSEGVLYFVETRIPADYSR